MKRVLPAVALVALTAALFYVAFAASSTAVPTTVSATGWVNATNVTADDAAEASNTNSDPSAIDVTGFGFALGATDVVDSIRCRIDTRVDGTSMLSSSFRLIKGGTPTGTDNGDWVIWDVTEATTNLSGGLWGTTWTYSDINAANFGFRTDVLTDGGGTVYVEFCQITVFYHTATTGTTKRVIGAAQSLQPNGYQ